MPKETLVINKFEGGLNTDIASRDLPEGFSPNLRNASVSKAGQIGVSGAPRAIESLNQPITGPITADFNSGYGLHTFGSDHFLNANNSRYDETIPVYEIVRDGTNDKKIRVFCGLPHNLSVGAQFYLGGDVTHSANNFDGVWTVYSVFNETIFDVVLPYTANASSVAAFEAGVSSTTDGVQPASTNVISVNDGSQFFPGDVICIDDSTTGGVGADPGEDLMRVISIDSDDLTVERFWAGNTATGGSGKNVHTDTFGSGKNIYKKVQYKFIIKSSYYAGFNKRYLALQNRGDFLILSDKMRSEHNFATMNTEAEQVDSVYPFFLEDDGSIRIKDTNFKNNSSDLYIRFNPPEEYFHTTLVNGYNSGANFALSGVTNNDGGLGSSPSNDMTNENDASSLKWGFLARLSNNGFMHIISPDLGPMDSAETWTITFDAALDTNPGAVFYISNGATDLPNEPLSSTKRLTNFYQVHDGKNCVILSNISGAGSSASYVNFWACKSSASSFNNMTISNFRIREGYKGRHRQWISSTSGIATPNINSGGGPDLQENANTVTTTGIGTSIPIGMALNVNGTAGNWSFSNSGETGVHNKTRWGISYLYDDIEIPQESLIQEFDNIYTSTGDNQKSITGEIVVHDSILAGNERLVGFRVYLLGSSSGSGSATKTGAAYLFATIDFRKHRGATIFNGTQIPWNTASDERISKINLGIISEVPEGQSYAAIAGDGWYNHDEVTIDAQYKTAVIANGRLYAGNIKQDTDGDGQAELYDDKIIISPPFRYDVLPATKTLPLAQDGQEIVKLAEINDKLLVFKQTMLYVIILDEEGERLEDSYEGLGVVKPNFVCRAPGNVIWANASGCWSFDGSQLVNLIKDKIGLNTWLDFTGKTGALVGYSQIDQTIIAYNSGTTYIYDIEKAAWTKSHVGTNVITNFVNWGWDSGALFFEKDGLSTPAYIQTTASGSLTSPQKAIGSFKFTGGDLNLTSNPLKFRNANGTEKTISNGGSISSASVQETAEFLVDAINSYSNANDQSFIASHNIPIGHSSFNTNSDFQEMELIAYITLEAKHYGTVYNQSTNASYLGSKGLYFGTSEGAGGLSGFEVVQDIAGGINPAGRSVTFTPVPNGTTTANRWQIVWGRDLFRMFTGIAVNQIASKTAGQIATALFNDIKSRAGGESGGEYIDDVATVTDNSGSLTIGDRLINVSDPIITDGSYHGYTDGYEEGLSGLSMGSAISWPENASIAKKYIPSNSDVFGGVKVGGTLFQYQTKDFTFRNPGVRKKIYKIYVTYKSDNTSAVHPYYYVNGLTGISNRKIFGDGSALPSTSGEWNSIELKPAISSESDNIYSYTIEFKSQSKVDPSFAINDITIIFRVKSVK